MTNTAPMLAAVMLAAVMLAACSGADGKALPPRTDSPTPPPDSAVVVMAAPVVEKPMPVAIDAIGTAEAFSVVAVHSQITAELTSVNFRDGHEVTKAQELFTLDRRPLDAAVQQAQANLDRELAQLANAKRQLQCYQDLADRGIATREQLDTRRTPFATTHY